MSFNTFSLNPSADEYHFSTSWNTNACEFIPGISSSSQLVQPTSSKSTDTKAQPPKPQEVFPVTSAFKVDESPQSAQAARKSSVEKPAEEVKKVSETIARVYTIEMLMSLKERYKTLPANVLIPELYALTLSKGKKTQSTAIKRAESVFVTCSILKKTEKPFMDKLKKTTDDLEKKSRELRAVLNKLSRANFEKLVLKILGFFRESTQTRELLSSLSSFVFERATAMSFAELYSKLCSRLRSEFKSLSLSTPFRKAIVEKCQECFYKEEEPLKEDTLMVAEVKRKRRLIGNIKFIGLLHKENMIKSHIMFECFNALLESKNLCEETLESCITLFKDTCPILVAEYPQDIAEYYERLLKFISDTTIHKRIIFMIQDLIDDKQRLMTPVLKARTSKKSSNKSSPVKSVAQPVVVEPTALDDASKENIRSITKCYVKSGSEEDWKPMLEKLIQQNHNLLTDVIIQVFKYGLYEYYKEDDLKAFANFLKFIVEDYNLSPNIIRNALCVVEEEIEEIAIDSPLSKKILVRLKEDSLNLIETLTKT